LVAEEILFKFMVHEDCEKDFLAEKEKRSPPLKIRATGFAGRSAAKPKPATRHFLSPGERIKGEGERKTQIIRRSRGDETHFKSRFQIFS
jgi:hypothetical protein